MFTEYQRIHKGYIFTIEICYTPRETAWETARQFFKKYVTFIRFSGNGLQKFIAVLHHIGYMDVKMARKSGIQPELEIRKTRAVFLGPTGYFAGGSGFFPDPVFPGSTQLLKCLIV